MSRSSAKPDQRLKAAWERHQSGNTADAEVVYRDVLESHPDSWAAWVYLGIVLFDTRRFEESVEAYRRAIAIQDPSPIAWNNLGNSLRMLGELDEADHCFATALDQKPEYLSALKNRGTLWIWAGEIGRGMRWYEAGLRVAPDDPEMHRNVGIISLLNGDFERGWAEYRWRWKVPGLFRPGVSPMARHWTGEPLAGKRFLLYPEQGLGDAIQFVRVAQQLRDRGARVVLHLDPKLIDLFSSAPGYDELSRQTIEPPATDFHASMIEAVDVIYQRTGEMDFGQNLFVDRSGVGAPSRPRGYLRVSDALCDYWRRWLDTHIPLNDASSLRVGINWQGNPDHHADVYRSIRLSEFQPLVSASSHGLGDAEHEARRGGGARSADGGNVQWVNLQFGYGVEQLSDVSWSDPIHRLPDDLDPPGKAFTDSAAIVSQLDAVVTTDTAMAHLAGSIGTPTVVLLGKVPDWRWGITGDHSDWYPTMRLVRQSTVGDWGQVMEQAADEIKSLGERPGSR